MCRRPYLVWLSTISGVMQSSLTRQRRRASALHLGSGGMSFHVWTKQKFATIAVASVTALTVGASLASVAGATVPHAKLPLITSFKASPNSLPDKGGTVKVTADVKFAKTCTLSVSPA